MNRFERQARLLWCSIYPADLVLRCGEAKRGTLPGFSCLVEGGREIRQPCTHTQKGRVHGTAAPCGLVNRGGRPTFWHLKRSLALSGISNVPLLYISLAPHPPLLYLALSPFSQRLRVSLSQLPPSANTKRARAASFKTQLTLPPPLACCQQPRCPRGPGCCLRSTASTGKPLSPCKPPRKRRPK